jgi:hypothetical protein
MNTIDQASEGLALIMRGCGALFWEEWPDGTFVLHVSQGGRGGRYADYKITQQQIVEAVKLIETGVPPLRGMLDPMPLSRTRLRTRSGRRRTGGKRCGGRR